MHWTRRELRTSAARMLISAQRPIHVARRPGLADRFEELRTSLAIVETSGVNSAAAKLGIARSAASKRLSDLEARLGVTLVERTNKRQFGLTEVGRGYYRDARRILDELTAAESRLTGVESGEGRPVVVVAEPAVATHLLAGPIASFLKGRPGTRVTLATGGSENADVLVPTGSVPNGHLLVTYSRLVVGAPSYLETRGEPASPADLLGHLGIGVSANGSSDWRFGTGSSTKPVIALDVPDVDAALAAAIAGVGLVQLPSYICERAIEAGMLRPVMDKHVVTGERVSIARGEKADLTADLLLEHLKTSLRHGTVRRG